MKPTEYEITRKFNYKKIIESINEWDIYNLIPENEKLNFLDIGAGTGIFSLPLLEKITLKNKFINYDAIDMNKKMLLFLEKKVKNINRENINFNPIHYKIKNNINLSKKYDIIFCAGIQHKINDWEILLSNLTQHLTRDGILIIGFRTDKWLKLVFGKKIDEKYFISHPISKIIKNYYDYLKKNKCSLSPNQLDKLSRIYDLHKTNKFLESIYLKPKKKFVIRWQTKFTFEEICNLIKQKKHTSFSFVKKECNFLAIKNICEKKNMPKFDIIKNKYEFIFYEKTKN